MESKFQLSDVIGAAYQNGNLQFFDSHNLASPIGNRVKVMDLKSDSSHTLECESNYNIVHIAFNADSSQAVLVNEDVDGHFPAANWKTCSMRDVFTEQKLVLVTKRGVLGYYEASLTPEEVKVPLEDEEKFKDERMFYKPSDKPVLYDKFESQGRPNVTCASFIKNNDLMAVGFENSEVVIVNLMMGVHVVKHLNLSLGVRIESVALSAQLLALGTGAGHRGALYVWDQRAELFVVKQQSHTRAIRTALFSPLGHQLATGGDDGLVKVWDAASSMCLVTLKGHTAPVTSICFTQTGNALLSAGMDGQVIAHDMKRYRNFRTMVTPKQTQLEHLCADREGLNCMASSANLFEIYVWAIENGALLDVLQGHTAPIQDLALHGLRLASCALDRTVRVWEVARAESECVQFGRECVQARFSPDGFYLAVLLEDAALHVLDAHDQHEVFVLEAGLDAEPGVERGARLAPATRARNRAFNRLQFSPTGALLLVGGHSNRFSLYDFQRRTILRRFQLSSNFSIGGTNPCYNPFTIYSTEVDGSDDEFGVEPIKAPGQAQTDLSLRKMDRPELELSEFAFSPTGRCFAAVSTEGVMMFSLDRNRLFRPLRLVEGATPDKARQLLHQKKHHDALLMALSLGEKDLTEEILMDIPPNEIQTQVRELKDQVAVDLLAFLSSRVQVAGRVHLHRVLLLMRHLVFHYGHVFKADKACTAHITGLQLYLRQQQDLIQLVRANAGLVDYELQQRELNQLTDEVAGLVGA